jgi:sigma-70-like protein
MDEVQRFCVRMLGDGPGARDAIRQAPDTGGERLATLRAAVDATRHGQPQEPGHGKPEGLAAAVAQELAQATSQLALAQREALALRELLRLSHAELAEVTGLPAAAVPSLLAQSRLALRAELRGPGSAHPPCDERERGLTTMALRQDGEEVPAADDEWLIEHLGHCRHCGQAHAAMLEAAACYRAWGT